MTLKCQLRQNQKDVVKISALWKDASKSGIETATSTYRAIACSTVSVLIKNCKTSVIMVYMENSVKRMAKWEETAEERIQEQLDLIKRLAEGEEELWFWTS